MAGEISPLHSLTPVPTGLIAVCTRLSGQMIEDTYPFCRYFPDIGRPVALAFDSGNTGAATQINPFPLRKIRAIGGR